MIKNADIRHLSQVSRHHCSTLEAAEVTAEADVKSLLLYHIGPGIPGNQTSTMALSGFQKIRIAFTWNRAAQQGNSKSIHIFLHNK